MHRVTAEHESEGIPAQLDLQVGDETRHLALELGDGQVVVPLPDASWTVDIVLPKR